MEWWQIILLLITGLVSGFINIVAGGGSLLTLPVLIFLGLDPNIANASNRVGIVTQNVTGIQGFRSKGVYAWPFSLYLGISAFFGAILGARVSLELDDRLFNRIIAGIMVLVVLTIIFGKRSSGDQQAPERMGFWYQAASIIVFFFIGIYGGFIQAGTGFLIIAALTGINRFSLVKTNSAKAIVALIYTFSALAVFIIEDAINWYYALVLAAGNAAGGWIASRWSVEKGDSWIRVILVIMVIVMAVKLWFFGR